ncbi:MAG: cytoskeleton protein RodZ [Gammaproteobacteria bacterium]|jgi:cytoskeleton protein RodZ
MLPTDNEKAPDSQPTGSGPGDRLQAARIKIGLSINDVANRMHLSKAILEALEENNFDEITAPIFVKGYLRAYARIVSLDEDEMIRQYNDFYSDDDPPISSTSNLVPELSIKDTRIKWATYLVVIAIVSLLVIWWWNQEQQSQETISLGAQSQEIRAEHAEVVVEPAAESTIEPSVESSVEPEVIVAEIEISALNAEAEKDAPDATDAVEVVEFKPAQTGSAVAAAEVEIEQQTNVDEPVAVVEKSISRPTGGVSRSAPTGSDRIDIIVNADTWADIKDGSGFQMIYDLLRANQKFSLKGEAPFALFFGNGHGVEVSFNDKAIDVMSHVRDDNTARLQIGG